DEARGAGETSKAGNENYLNSVPKSLSYIKKCIIINVLYFLVVKYRQNPFLGLSSFLTNLVSE
ncbi:MAG: hypothetical protein ACTS7C_00520, partial [Candidatus Hodgkinia cicadicola]